MTTTPASTHSIYWADFIEQFQGSPRDNSCARKTQFEKLNTRYKFPNAQELDEYRSSIEQRIQNISLHRDEVANRSAWQVGWSEYLEIASRPEVTFSDLKPKYFRGSNFFRYKKNIVYPENHHIEYDLFTEARHLLFSKYLKPYDSIFEFGSGSGQNLLLLSDIFPDKEIRGYDWVDAAVHIAERLGKNARRKISGGVFNMKRPLQHIDIPNNTACITIHSMEQLGTEFREIVQYWCDRKAALVLNYEPIIEMYDLNNKFDKLADRYSRSRGYLEGLWPTLQSLEKEGRIEICDAFRPCVGGVFHEASVIVWRPLT